MHPVLRLSEHAQRSADQAIGFLMQQAVENADCISLAAGLVDEQSLPVEAAREAVAELLSDVAAGRKILQYGITPGPEPLRRVFRSYLAELEQHPDGLKDLPLSQLMLTTGSQQLLSLVSQALFNPGDICLIADLLCVHRRASGGRGSHYPGSCRREWNVPRGSGENSAAT